MSAVRTASQSRRGPSTSSESPSSGTGGTTDSQRVKCRRARGARPAAAEVAERPREPGGDGQQDRDERGGRAPDRPVQGDDREAGHRDEDADHLAPVEPLVEQDRAALDALRANLAKLGAGGEVRAQSVLALAPAARPLDMLLMDPPYGSGAGAVALDKLARLGWTGPASWISIETARDEKVEVAGFAIDAERVHGKARLTLLRAG